MSMTVAELMEMLEDLDPELKVRIAEQPNYPFEYELRGVVEFNPKEEEISETMEQLESLKRADPPQSPEEAEARAVTEAELQGDLDDLEAKKVCYLVEGSQLAYLSREIWNMV